MQRETLNAKVREIRPIDRAEWLRMRRALWPGSHSDHDIETAAYFDGACGSLLVLVAELDGRMVGFLELDERKYAPGCERSPVAFVEGWYADPDVRRLGVGRALLAAAEAIALEKGHVELASDAEIENEDGLAVHAALGFQEIERVVCLRKALRRQ